MRSDIEWGDYQATVASSCATTTTIPLSVAGFNRFTVTVGRTSMLHRERNDTYSVYVITATATVVGREL